MRRRLFALIGPLVVAAALLPLACSGSPGTGLLSSDTCMPGVVQACSCLAAGGVSQGIQLCGTTGSFLTCVCNPHTGKDGGGTDADGKRDGTVKDGGFIDGGGHVDAQADSSGNNGDSGIHPDPTTCAEAAQDKSYIGCEFWPTVTTNPVWSIFDFAVVVANAQATTATVTVTGPNNTHQTVTVAPGTVSPIYLPWVAALKGPDSDSCGNISPSLPSVSAPGSAYHLLSSVPVMVYQFNALEYQGIGGPPGKDWSACPGLTECASTLMTIGCFSFTNDASLLLPTTAMTTTYRVTGEHGSTASNQGGYIAVTGTAANTTVTMNVSSTGAVAAGTGIAATAANGILSFTLNAGDVALVMGSPTDTVDLSGSLLLASAPIQVIAGIQCVEQPSGAAACDHLESSVFPSETWGDDYVVTVPTSPHAAVIGHVVRMYGDVDNTTLTYLPSQPAGCPSTLNAGEVVECGQVATTFEVFGSAPFAVSSFMLGGSLADPNAAMSMQLGDPSMSPMIPVQQYRTKVSFLAPVDYAESYADVVIGPSTTLKLDGVVVTAPPETIDAAWSVVRIALGAGSSGAHLLTGTEPFGVQVIGYGNYTSYQYPAGLNLRAISSASH